jgi:hypothetical protein
MTREPHSDTQAARAVYDRHVKPVEHEHVGEYALVTPDGQVSFARTLVDIMIRAHERPSAENAIFKVGDVVLGKLR